MVQENKTRESIQSPQRNPEDAPRHVEIMQDDGYDRGRGGGHGGGGRQRDRGDGGNGGVSLQTLLIIVAIAVVLAVVVVSGGYTGLMSSSTFKAQNDTQMTNINAAYDKAVKAVTDVGTAVAAIPNQVSTQVTTSINNIMAQINSQITTATNAANTAKEQAASAVAQVNSANTQLAAINKSVTDMNTSLTKSLTDATAKIDTLMKQATADAARITALETKAIVPITPAKNISATVKMQSSVLFATAPIAGTPPTASTLTSAFRITLINNTAVAINDIVLDMIINTTLPNNNDVASFNLAGGGTIWQGQGIFADTREFVNTQWGLNLAASETKTLYLTITIIGKTTPTLVDFTTGVYVGGVAYNVDVTVQ